jgi:hypothetical protein
MPIAAATYWRENRNKKKVHPCWNSAIQFAVENTYTCNFRSPSGEKIQIKDTEFRSTGLREEHKLRAFDKKM